MTQNSTSKVPKWNVHSSLISNSPKMEATQMSVNRTMDEKLRYILSTEYYSAIKNKKTEIATHSKTLC